MKGFHWNEDTWQQFDKNKKPCDEDEEKRDSGEIMALVIPRQGARGRGKMQPLFAYHLNPAANDPQGEVVKTNMSYFFR